MKKKKKEKSLICHLSPHVTPTSYPAMQEIFCEF